jgi:hypothetical protein
VHRLTLRKGAQKTIAHQSRPVREQMIREIDQLEADPDDPTLDVEHMVGGPEWWLRSEEDLEDRQMAEAALAEESLPWPDGQAAAAWRVADQGLAQTSRPDPAGVGRGGRRSGDLSVATGDRPEATIALAKALSVTVDDLVGERPD